MFKRCSDTIVRNVPFICGLTGFLDAGLGAKIASDFLISNHIKEVLFTFKTDKYLDMRQRRPSMVIKDGEYEKVVFDSIEVILCADNGGREFLVMVGPEPDLRWKKFAKEFSFLLDETLPQIFINLGAFPAPAPHTRPIKIAAISPYKDLAESIGFVKGTIEVPASMGSYLAVVCHKKAIASVGIWARVPHYVSQMAYFPAGLALVNQIAKLTGLDINTAKLSEKAIETNFSVDEMVSKNEEHKKLVSLLEAGVDVAEGSSLDIVQIPSGDEIAKELERFLKEQGNFGN